MLRRPVEIRPRDGHHSGRAPPLLSRTDAELEAVSGGMTCEAALVVAEIHAMTVQALGALGKGQKPITLLASRRTSWRLASNGKGHRPATKFASPMRPGDQAGGWVHPWCSFRLRRRIRGFSRVAPRVGQVGQCPDPTTPTAGGWFLSGTLTGAREISIARRRGTGCRARASCSTAMYRIYRWSLSTGLAEGESLLTICSLCQTWRLCGYQHLVSVNRPLTKPAHRHP